MTKRRAAPRFQECVAEGCIDRAWSNGWCKSHYMRWYVHGDPGIPECDEAAHAAIRSIWIERAES